MKRTTFDLKKLESPDPKVKYGFSKELLQIAGETPKLLYPYVEQWASLIREENQILKWTAIDILGHLSSIDTDDRIDPLIEDLIELLYGGHLITISHAISSLSMIAKNKRSHERKIWYELLESRNNKFKCDTFRDIATGKVLDVLKKYSLENIDFVPLSRFIEQADQCAWDATRKKAEIVKKRLDRTQGSTSRDPES